MDLDRVQKIVAALAQAGTPDLTTYPQQVCAAAVGLLGMSGAALAFMSDGEPAAVWASDLATQQLEDAQLTLGEGPGMEAAAAGAPVLEPDLDLGSARWPFFRRMALDGGIRAVFAFPLQVGVIRIGVLSLYRYEPGFLSDDQLAEALILADVATNDMLDLQAVGEVSWAESDGAGRRARIHQATGMTAAQLGVPMADALARLRARAFSSGRTIYEVADDVVSRSLRLE